MPDLSDAAANDFARMWDQIEDDLGFNDARMLRARPYDGQPHTDTGIRGRTEIKGITFRDLRDCFIRAVCLSNGGAHDDNMPFYREAEKGEHAALCENDLYKLKGIADPMAICQNLCCEIERLMGIFPNVPPLMPTTDDQENPNV
jgi:hypothetical protein